MDYGYLVTKDGERIDGMFWSWLPRRTDGSQFVEFRVEIVESREMDAPDRSGSYNLCDLRECVIQNIHWTINEIKDLDLLEYTREQYDWNGVDTEKLMVLK